MVWAGLAVEAPWVHDGVDHAAGDAVGGGAPGSGAARVPGAGLGEVAGDGAEEFDDVQSAHGE